jgi:hypothetical protein
MQDDFKDIRNQVMDTKNVTDQSTITVDGKVRMN